MKDQKPEKSSGVAEIQGDSELDQVVKNMPVPSPDVVTDEVGRLGKETLLDPKGRPFDKDLHLTNPDGTPKINKKTGKLCLKPGPEKKDRINSKFRDQDQDQVENQGLGISESRMCAEFAVNAFNQIGVMCFKDKGHFVKDDRFDERETLVSSTEAYFREKNVRDVPPGLALSLAVGGYFFRRIDIKASQPKIKLVFAWVQNKVHQFFSWVTGIFKGSLHNASYVDTRANGVGENDSRRETGAEV